MGVDYSIYCGPVVVCKTKNIKVEETKRGFCSKCDENDTKESIRFCKTSIGVNKYCSKCGRLLMDFTFLVEKNQDQYEITEEMNENLCSPSGDHYHNYDDEYHLYIPNVRHKELKRTLTWDCSNEIKSQYLTCNQINKETVWLSETFRKEIDVLFKHYGHGNVEIKFVVLNEIW